MLFLVVLGCFRLFWLFWVVLVCLFVCLFVFFVCFFCLFVCWLVGWLVGLFVSFFVSLFVGGRDRVADSSHWHDQPYQAPAHAVPVRIKRL